MVVQVVVVVPTFNEADNIESLISGVFDAVPYASIIVVDDASPDGTADRAEAMASESGQVLVVRRTAKTGLGDAYRAGLAAAIENGADICVQMDADMSHDPVTLPALIANIEHGADLAIGSRYVPGGVTEAWPWRRRWLSRWANRYAAGVLGLAVNDATGGYRAYSTGALQRVQYHTSTAQGFGFQVEMTHRMVRHGCKVVEFPITFRDRTVGSSKLSRRIVNEALVLVLRLWISDFGGRRRRRARGA